MEIETHPFEPWLPSNAKLLMLGTFPPAPKTLGNGMVLS